MKKGLIIIFCMMFLASFVFVTASITSYATADANQNQVQVNTNTHINSADKDNDSKEKIEPKERAEVEYKIRERYELSPEEKQRIIQVKNRLEVRARLNQSECPGECECDGSTIKCILENRSREMTIHAGKSGNMIIQVKNTNASTQVQLYKSDDGKVYGRFMNNETREIILPDEIKARIEARLRTMLENQNITLDENGTYQIEARKRARLFGLFPVKERVRIEMNSETGEITRTRTSWWGFLARDETDANINEEDNSTE